MPAGNKTERVCIHTLEVTNFKSYGGTLTIGPFKDFTCVIGPNGSGTVLARAPRPRGTLASAAHLRSAFAARAVSVPSAFMPSLATPASPCARNNSVWSWALPRALQARAVLRRVGFHAAFPPAAGKSNLMDAVSFVMGVNTKDLRGAKVADFRSHGVSKSDANTSVTLHHRDTSRRSLPLLPPSGTAAESMAAA